MPKKRNPRAEFHGIFLVFVECEILQKIESPKKEEFQLLKRWNWVEIPSDLARAKMKLSGLFLKPSKNRLVKPILEIKNLLKRPWVVLLCCK